MKVLLTGITGNVGYEVGAELRRRGVAVSAWVRPGRAAEVQSFPYQVNDIVEHELIGDSRPLTLEGIDSIVHCAGVVHFKDAQHQNAAMMESVLAVARLHLLPVHFVSTAFVYRPEGDESPPHNSYEADKRDAERMLEASGISYGISRPSVITGHSTTGALRNFSGYYAVVSAFVSAVQASRTAGRRLRFPRMPGRSDMVPVDRVAEIIASMVIEGSTGIQYVTNPDSPSSSWVLAETLSAYDLADWVEIVDVPFLEFGNLDLTDEEVRLYRYAVHFNPYWSMEYAFPRSACTQSFVTSEYLQKALTNFRAHSV